MNQKAHLLDSIEVISASAGTGKTYRLTERIVEAVRGGVEPERIMATTFTVKAAAELRGRVRESLTSEGYPELGARVSDAYIGTVHSLCFRLLTEYAIDAGISPNVDVLPDADADRIFNIAVATAIDSVAEALEPPARRMGRTGEGSGYGKEPDWREDVRRIVGAARANGMTAADLRAQAAGAVTMWDTTVATPGVPPTTADLIAAVTTAVNQLTRIAAPLKGTQRVTEMLQQVLTDVAGGRSIPWRTWVELATAEPKRDATGVLDPVHRIARRVGEAAEFLADFRTMVEGVYTCAADALDQFTEYKRDRGITDYDDLEASLVRLLTDTHEVQQGIRERIDIVMVDEFQDTSPMQLALFLQLHRVVGRSVWVGDPKQAIYGFRGTDPTLMTRIADLLDSRETLSHSWRSKQAILDLTNALFTQTLYDTPREKIELTLPHQRATEGRGGNVSAWYLDGKNKGDDARAIATGVAAFLKAHPKRTAGDIAILCRTNPYAAQVAQALGDHGIRASVSAGLLIETREAQILLAALRYLADTNDTLSLAELMVLLSPEAGGVPRLISAPDETIAAWRAEPVPAELARIGEWGDRLSIAEATDAVIAVTDLMRCVSGWSRPDVRRANIETLRGLAGEYEELQRAARAPASLHGFVAYVREAETGQAQGSGPDSCVVTTYHGAKGLEWPIVILAELDKTFADTLFGVHTVPADHFDPEHPLANRRIHYWPWPFGSKKKFPHLNEILAATPLQQQITSAQHDESVRLLYVGSTRAKDHLIFALRNRPTDNLGKPGDGWLQRLVARTGTPLINWPTHEGPGRLSIGTDAVPVDIAVYTPGEETVDSDGQGHAGRITPLLLPIRPDPGDRGDTASRHLPRSIVPSHTTNDPTPYHAKEVAPIGSPITVPSPPPSADPDATALGTAVHAVFAASPIHRLPEKTADILRRWDIGGKTAHAIAEPIAHAVEALETFLRARYTVTTIHREVPVALRYDNGQEMHGWIDLVVHTPDGWVIVDHKTHRSADPASVAVSFGPQLAHYRRAVEQATGEPVVETLINFVLLGVVYRVGEDRST